MPNIEKTLGWMKAREGKVGYSMDYRGGPNYYDCSSAVYFALWAGGFTTILNYAGSTENLFKEKGHLFTEISRNQIRRGDVFVSGVEGKSGGAAGHTGFVWDKNHIIHCNWPSRGIAITNIAGRTGTPCRWFRVNGAGKGVVNVDIKNKSNAELAQMVLDGKFGTGAQRKKALGTRYKAVQKIIDDYLVHGKPINAGKVKAGWKSDSKGWWYVKSDGSCIKNNWVHVGSSWYWALENGYLLEKNWKQINGNWYWFKKGGYMAKSETLNINGKQCYFNDWGALVTETKYYRK